MAVPLAFTVAGIRRCLEKTTLSLSITFNEQEVNVRTLTRTHNTPDRFPERTLPVRSDCKFPLLRSSINRIFATHDGHKHDRQHSYANLVQYIVKQLISWTNLVIIQDIRALKWF